MILVHILPTFCYFNSTLRGLENATQIAKYPRVFIVKSLNKTYSSPILSWTVSGEFPASFKIFGLTLIVLLEKGLIQRFYLNNLMDLIIKA